MNVKRLLIFLNICLLAFGVTNAQASEGLKKEPSVVFLVRHAEKMAQGGDPGLTSEGKERAQRLVYMLKDAGIEQVHSTDYRRTRETVRPFTEYAGLKVRLYDPRKPQTLIDRIVKKGGRYLIAGHSNTIPSLVNMLGGKATDDINEASEYDRLYIVTTASDGSVSTVLLRY